MNIYCSGHINSRTVCQAMHEGTGWPIVPPMPLQPGGVFLYGQLRGLQETLKAARASKREWYYADRGHLCASSGSDYSGYFRVTRNAYQCDGLGESDGKRFRALGLEIKPWRNDGEHILICPPSEIWGQLNGFCSNSWLEKTILDVKNNTDRKIIVRRKNEKKSFYEQLEKTHILVTHSSNCAVLGLLEGIPCAVSKMSCCYGISTPMSGIETPNRFGDRERFFSVLADNQLTLQEARDGLMLEWLKR